MSQNNMEENINGKSISKRYFDENPMLTFILLIFIIKNLSTISTSSDLKDDEYIVAMGENPAFPLEEKGDIQKEKKTLIYLQNQKDLFTMIDILKPHMSYQNRYVINIFEKWLQVLNDLQSLTTSLNLKDNTIGDLEKEQPKSLLKFLYDIKPFIHPDYHNEIEGFIQGINSILDIQNSIYNLQYVLNQTKNSNDDATKIHTIINALRPLMGESQKKNLDKFKKLSSILEMINIDEDTTSTKNTPNNTADNRIEQRKEDKAELLEILDLFDKPSDDLVQDREETNRKQEKTNYSNIEDNSHEKILVEEEKDISKEASQSIKNQKDSVPKKH